MEIKYELQPTTTDQRELERTIYVLARCMSMGGFSISSEIYNQLSEDEKSMFKPKASLG